MPNWCTNSIYIYGEPKKLKMIEKILKSPSEKENEGVFTKLIGKDENYVQDDWYSHNSNRFGTKWDIDFSEHQFTFDGDCITIQCETAWSPPTEFLMNFTQMYGLRAEMTYEEPGNDFAGKVEIHEGDIVVDEQYEYAEGVYHFDNDYFWEGVVISQIEYWVDEEMEEEEIKNYFAFLSDDEKDEVLEIYRDYVKSINKEE